MREGYDIKEKPKITELLNLKVPFILASKSPRRRRLLTQLGFDFKIMPADIEEENVDIRDPAEFVTSLALAKAEAIAANLDQKAVILGSDTTVVIDGEMINKPADKEEAYRMLKSLSGRTHTVYTGIALVESVTGRFVTDLQKTDVHFRDLDDDEINAYIDTGSPMDKAGAYGIQDDFGAVFVDNIEGCYYNIVGLPLELFYRKMKEFLK